MSDTALRQRSMPKPVQSQSVKPVKVQSVTERELQNSEQLVSLVLYTLLLFATVIGGITYSLLYFEAGDNIARARIPKSAQHILDHPSYFADKRNILNQLFVKKGWAWTTLAFGLIVASKPQRSAQTYLKPVCRWVLATTYWVLFTTWFFGPSFSDRVLLWTGAVCVPASYITNQSLSTQGLDAIALNPALCMSGSQNLWLNTKSTQILGEGLEGLRPQGKPFFHSGHDVSGHTFILVLSSLFLLAELSPNLKYVIGTREQRAKIKSWQRTCALVATCLIGLWWLMLLMTSIYFHSPQEKISGFLVGIAGPYLTHFLVGR